MFNKKLWFKCCLTSLDLWQTSKLNMLQVRQHVQELGKLQTTKNILITLTTFVLKLHITVAKRLPKYCPSKKKRKKKCQCTQTNLFLAVL